MPYPKASTENGFQHFVWEPPRPEGVPGCASYFRAKGEVEGRWRACRRRSCKHCGPKWLAMQSQKMRLNLGAFCGEAGRVVLISLTAPGADLLPWACDKDHKHAGSYGCVVERRCAVAWAEAAPEMWKRLRDAAKRAVDRAGLPVDALVVERVWEPQKRGVPHLHVVAGARTPRELEAAERFHQELRRLAPEYGFGPQLHLTRPMDGREAARYLGGYLLGRSRKKGTIRDNLNDRLMPRLLVWETPAIGSISRSERMVEWQQRLALRGGTGVTIRRLRYARWYLAALKQKAHYPKVRRGVEVIAVAKVAALLERGPPESWYSHAKTLLVMRDLAEAAA